MTGVAWRRRLAAAAGLTIAGVHFGPAPAGVQPNDAVAILLPRPPSNDVAQAGVRLVLHVGPPKTATTSIQCNLDALERSGMLSDLLRAKVVERESCRPSDKERLLREYMVRFPVRWGHVFDDSATPQSTATRLTSHKAVVEGGSFLPLCISDVWAQWNGTTAQYPDCWGGSYRRYIDNFYRHENRDTFIISNEILAPAFGGIKEPERCSQIFGGMLASLGANSTVDIVFTLRYFFEWVVSMHGQEYGGKFGVKPRLGKWPGAGPGRGGKAVPTIEEYITHEKGAAAGIFLRAIKCFQAASRDNDRVRFRVINFHDGDVLSAFFDVLAAGDERIASGLVNATGASQQRANTASGRSNGIAYDRVAVAAFNQHLFDTSTSRADARSQVERAWNASQLKMIYKCPTSEDFHEALLGNSLELQRAAFPQNSSAEKDATQAFWRAVEAKRFCDADGAAIATHHLPRLIKSNS